MAVVSQTHTGPEKGGNYEFHWCGSFLEVHLISDVGKKRSRNEDCCALCVPDDRQLLDDRGVLLAVADGMGGVSGGDFASRLALQTLAEEYYSRRESTTPARLNESVNQANRRIFQEAENHPEYYGMGTTISVMLIMGDHAYIAQVGDSRVYLLRKSEPIWQITDDHSLVAEQVRNGYISEQEARTHSLKNLITRAVGTKEAVAVDLFAVQIKQGDTFLICSDGLSNVVEDMELGKAMSAESLQGVARVLVGRALQAGAPDNVTAALIRVTAVPPKSKLEPGAQKVSPARPGLLSTLRKLIS